MIWFMIENLIFLILFIGLIKFIYSKIHLLINLLRLEFISLSIFFLLNYVRIKLIFRSFFSLYLLVIIVCEGVLGLSILIVILFSFRRDYIKIFNRLEC